MKRQNGGFIGTLLIGLSLLLFLGSFAFFFLPLVNRGATSTASMFYYMFDGMHVQGEPVTRIPWMTAIFAFQVINTIIIVFLIYTIISKQHSATLSYVLMGIVCLFALIGLIASFNAVDIYKQATSTSYAINFQLGLGPILYSVTNLVAIISCVAGIILSRLGL